MRPQFQVGIEQQLDFLRSYGLLDLGLPPY